ncbi:MAG: endonuclease MutS2 [bacterium]|nr:endonuclease MutS2 [bacterium]
MLEDNRFSFQNLEWDKIHSLLRKLAVTELGGSEVDSMEPLADIEEVNYHLDINEEMQQIIIRSLSFPLGGSSDLEEIIRMLSIRGSILTPDDINQVVSNLETAKNIKIAFKEYVDDFEKTAELIKQLEVHQKLISSIRKKIDEGGQILDGASADLKRIRRKIMNARDKMKSRIEALVKQYTGKKALQESLYTIKDGRYTLPVKAGSIKSVRGITHQVSATGATHFVEPDEIVEQNNIINVLISNEKEEILRILRSITEELSEIMQDIENNQYVLSKLDYHYACGSLAYKLGAINPDVIEKGVLVINGARHPLLIMKAEKPEDVVPVTIELGNDFGTLVLSGPNAGGKTVAIKTIGLLCIMARFGLMIPVLEDTKIPMFNRIIAEIGDPQSIDDDLSTFSAKLMNIKAFIDGISDNDLILVDEIGTGTDPQEGVNLAIAIIEYLRTRNVKTIVTTHHGGLKIYANHTENVENASLAFDENTLKPTYRLTVGVPGSSYALELSRKIGLPDVIIEKTIELMGDKRVKLEDFIRELEQQMSDYSSRINDLKKKEAKMEEAFSEYSKTKKTIEKEVYSKVEDEIKRSEVQIDQFNKQIERMVKEIRETKASHETIIKVKDTIKEEKEKVKKRRTRQKKTKEKIVVDDIVYEIEKGDAVRLKGQHQIGEVVSLSKDKKKAVVQFDSMKLDVKKDKLEKVYKKEKPQIITRVPVVQVKPEIDLRGLEAIEAVQRVDQYLSDAMATGLNIVYIIHGKGTGVLRKKVGEFLRSDKRVGDYRLGTYGEGDTGVTIVNLK